MLGTSTRPGQDLMEISSISSSQPSRPVLAIVSCELSTRDATTTILIHLQSIYIYDVYHVCMYGTARLVRRSYMREESGGKPP